MRSYTTRGRTSPTASGGTHCRIALSPNAERLEVQCGVALPAWGRPDSRTTGSTWAWRSPPGRDLNIGYGMLTESVGSRRHQRGAGHLRIGEDGEDSSRGCRAGQAAVRLVQTISRLVVGTPQHLTTGRIFSSPRPLTWFRKDAARVEGRDLYESVQGRTYLVNQVDGGGAPLGRCTCRCVPPRPSRWHVGCCCDTGLGYRKDDERRVEQDGRSHGARVRHAWT